GEHFELWRSGGRLRQLAGLSALLLGAALACGDAAKGEEGAIPDHLRPRAAAAAEAAAEADRVLVLGVRRLPEALDPLAVTDEWGARVIDDLLFEGLVASDPSGAPWARPVLADRCE